MAERAPDHAQYPGVAADLLVPGSLVFDQPDRPVDLRDPRNWWSWVPGTQWRHPEGPESTLQGRERHPVTHVAYEDAAAFTIWAGKALPSEAEWERAARGGLEGAVYCAPDYCLRYRPAARQGQAVETSSTHIGFRCVVRTAGQGVFGTG
jgi:sulfatase modifying factor 1